MDTNTRYSPHDQLPVVEPRYENPSADYFYQNTVKHLVKDTVRIMNNGLHIDLDRVEELEKVLDDQLAQVKQDIAKNPIIAEFQQKQHKLLIKNYIEDRKSKMRSPSDYLKPFKHTDMIHRSYFMHLYAQQQNIPLPNDLLPGSTFTKWPVNLVKTFAKTRPVLQRLLDGTLANHTLMDEAMQLLAEHKCAIYNEKYLTAIKEPDVPIPEFNPASSKQKQELFTWLGIESEKTSKDTGLPSFDRSQIERINKETTDENVRNFTQSFIDHSFAAIVRNNFIEAFYRYTVDNRLHGQYKLFGAKSFRYTSSNPNMLNMPSTGSIFAKPIKKCFTAPDDFIIATADYSALENRVIANLSGDENLSNIYLQNLDGHCMNALYYFKEDIAEHMEFTGNTIEDVRTFNKLRKSIAILDEIRQRSKPVSFGLQYGAYPPKVAASIKCSLAAAEVIFNRYHNELYPSVTKFREEYVLPTAHQNGQIHLGLGCYIKTDNPERDIRTITNACSQFWSILTALAINKMHQLIDEAGLQDDIIITSTIYDSVYFEVRKRPEIIKWLNDHLIPIMNTDFLQNQVVPNDCALDIGPSWAELKELHHNASTYEITAILSSYKTYKWST